jgi:hypothetical protein
MPRRSQDEIRVLVAEGLLNLDRPDLLDESNLLSVLDIREKGFLVRGKLLREQLLQAAGVLSQGLGDVPAMALHKSLLDHVVEGGQSPAGPDPTKNDGKMFPAVSGSGSVNG